MKKALIAAACLAVATTGPILAAQKGTSEKTSTKGKAAKPDPKSPESIDYTVLHVQVILDKLGFTPGVLDGKGGQSLVAALKGFQEAQGLPTSGKIDQATLRALYPYRAWRPTRTLVLTEEALRGPFVGQIPKDPKEQALLPAMGYKNATEALAERFHTNEDTLIALNPNGRLVAGQTLIFPNALPTSRDYSRVKDEKARAMMSALNVSGDQPEAAKVVVDKSDGVLRVFDKDERLIAQFNATMGSSRDPLPLGTWKILTVAYNPPWNYNPEILKTADKSDPKLTIKPGPNNPVGVTWIDLSKEHYGIHGTSEPQQIGRAESNGCIRLTNWDAARLALMVRDGIPAIFQA